MCKVMSIRHVARYCRLDRDTVKEIDCRLLERELGPVDLSGVEAIGMDEFARKRVLWVGRGRSRDEVRPFFDLLGVEGCKRLKAVAMDMSAAYGEEVRARCPSAEDQVRLEERLAANKALMTVYVLKDDLKTLWHYRNSGYARAFWQQWRRRAMSSGTEPLKAFTRRLRPYLDGILAHCRWPLGTNIIASTTPPSPEMPEEPRKRGVQSGAGTTPQPTGGGVRAAPSPFPSRVIAPAGSPTTRWNCRTSPGRGRGNRLSRHCHRPRWAAGT
jgi:hypothetical protein